jgi:hypothetical protein
VVALPAGPPASPEPVVSSAAFNFDAPWAYRGAVDPVANGLETITSEWAFGKGVSASSVDLVPLYGEMGNPRVVYAARVRGTDVQEYGVVLLTEGGPDFLERRPLLDSSTALIVSGRGDAVGPTIVVVAAPDSRSIEYAADGVTFSAIATPFPGIGITRRGEDILVDAVRVVGADGGEAYRAPVQATLLSSPSPGTSTSARPDNVLGWPARGTNDTALVERAAQGYATSKGVTRAQVKWEVLLTADTDGGQRYAMLNAWVLGQRAQVFGWIETPGRDPEPQSRPFTEKGVAVAALMLTEIPGSTVDQLVLVYQPRTGDVLYRASATEKPRSVLVDYLEGWTTVDRERDDREKGAVDDRLLVLDGNGDLDNPTFDGTVASLLCGEKSCS